MHRYLFPGWVSPVDKSTMTSILSAIASGMITLSGLVFSLVFVLVQFGSATYSPRITRVFAHSHVLHHSLGVFTGTFLYALMAMRTIGMEEMEQVSGIAVWVAMVWLLASVSMLARMIQVFGTMTVTNILAALSLTGRKSIARIYGPWRGIPGPSAEQALELLRSQRRAGQKIQRIIYEGEPGYVNAYDIRSLTALARKTATVIYLPYSIGDSLKDGAAIAFIQGDNPSVPGVRIYEAMELGVERTFERDPKYTFRLLVDTAIRALSPAVNDPTTAVQALDHIESLLRRLGNSDLEIGHVRDGDGTTRLVYKTPSWEDYLQLGLSEIMQYGADSIQVERRIEALLLFLRENVPPERAEAVERFLKHRRELSDESFDDATFRQLAGIADREGIGSGADGLAILVGKER
jgi:uncharacterized membrane protein